MRSILVAAIVASSWIFTGSGFAADSALCVGYVQEALQQAKEARELGCGFDMTDPKWSEDPKVHADWCGHAADSSVMEQMGHDWSDWTPDSRTALLAACRVCRAYTDRAMQQEAEEVQLQCHFAGPRWPKTDSDGDIYSKHMTWCMGLDAGEVGHLITAFGPNVTNRTDVTGPETAARDAELNQCRACREFAKAAAADFASKQCSPLPFPWSAMGQPRGGPVREVQQGAQLSILDQRGEQGAARETSSMRDQLGEASQQRKDVTVHRAPRRHGVEKLLREQSCDWQGHFQVRQFSCDQPWSARWRRRVRRARSGGGRHRHQLARPSDLQPPLTHSRKLLSLSRFPARLDCLSAKLDSAVGSEELRAWRLADLLEHLFGERKA